MAKRKAEEPKKGAPEWMATFSDLVTLLFCFFVLLYAMSNVDSSKLQAISASLKGEPILTDASASEGLMGMLGNGITELPTVEVEDYDSYDKFETMQEEMDEMYTDFKTYFAENKVSEKIELTKTDKYINVTLKDKVLFAKGQAQIEEEAIPILNIIAEIVSSKYSQSEIEIIGHTDNDPIHVPIFPDNWFLSAGRAINVGKYFIDNKGFSPNKVSTIGRGEFNPLVENTTEENKSKNRRVEIRIYSSFIPQENQ